MNIKRARAADANVVAGLVFELLSEFSGNEPSGYSVAELTGVANSLLNSKDIAAVLAEHNGEPVGVLVLNGCASLYAGRFGEITEMYVKPGFRSSRVGEALVEEAVQMARERSWSRLEVGAPEQPTWNRSLRFYKRNGFTETGVRLKLPV